MKKAFTVLFFCFLSYNFFAGCGGISCKSSNGITLSGWYPWPTGSDITTAYITSVDSVTLYLRGIGGCGIHLLQITVDGVQINRTIVPYTDMTVKVLGIPGKYMIHAIHGTSSIGVSFTFLLAVGIPKTSSSNEQLSIFPNPATNELNILSKNDAVKHIKIYNSNGQELENKKVEGGEIQIPLNNYPAGIYFIHVATISDKIIIKKISVL